LVTKKFRSVSVDTNHHSARQEYLKMIMLRVFEIEGDLNPSTL